MVSSKTTIAVRTSSIGRRRAASELGRPPQNAISSRSWRRRSRSPAGESRGSSARSSRRRDPAQGDEDRPSSRLGGVGREHRRDPHRREHLAVARPAQRRSEPRSLRRAAGGSRASRRAPDAIARLREVDELEVQPERPHDALERVGLDRQDIERHPLVPAAPPARRSLAAGSSRRARTPRLPPARR